jgi:hypothetical protein
MIIFPQASLEGKLNLKELLIEMEQRLQMRVRGPGLIQTLQYVLILRTEFHVISLPYEGKQSPTGKQDGGEYRLNRFFFKANFLFYEIKNRDTVQSMRPPGRLKEIRNSPTSGNHRESFEFLPYVVTPAKAGVRKVLKKLDTCACPGLRSGIRRYDDLFNFRSNSKLSSFLYEEKHLCGFKRCVAESIRFGRHWPSVRSTKQAFAGSVANV